MCKNLQTLFYQRANYLENAENSTTYFSKFKCSLRAKKCEKQIRNELRKDNRSILTTTYDCFPCELIN